MAVIFVPVSPYVKKEDAKKALKFARFVFASTYLGLAVCLLIFVIFVHPKLLNLMMETQGYESPNYPILLGINLSTIVLFLITSGYYFMSHPNYRKLNAKLKKYHAREMILKNEIFDLKKDTVLALVFLLIFGVVLWFTTISPIFTLTNQI
jgi:uncharacterized membrane protein YqhA